MSAFAARLQAAQSPLERAHQHLTSSRALSPRIASRASRPRAPLLPAFPRSWDFTRVPVQFTPPPTLQTKLVVNEPGDRYEQEAERLAARIIRFPAPSPQPLSSISQSQVPQPVVQRNCHCGGTCPKCQRQDEDSSHILQRQAVFPQPVSLSSTVHPILRTPGRPLDVPTRSFMEPRFGHSLSHVRIHDDSAAATTAATLQARAYTVGHHIVFASGELQPSTSSGRQLLAHELTHVLQQGTGSPASVTPAAPMIQRQARGAAGGCGICQGGDSRATGTLVHQIVQSAFGPLGGGIKGEHPVQVVRKGVPAPFTPELDLSRETPHSHWGRLIEIGEIKPLDDAGTQLAIARTQLSDYAGQLRFTHDEVFRLKDPPPTEIPYPNPARPPGCSPQVIHVQLTEPGIYQYYCEPPWSELVADPRCKCKNDEKDKKKARAVRTIVTPKEQKKTTIATPQPKAHLYLEEVDPAFRNLTRGLTAREAAPGQELFVLVDSDFYQKSVKQQQADQLARQTRLMQVDPRSVPMLQLTVPLSLSPSSPES